MSLYIDDTLVMDDTTAEVPLDWSPLRTAAPATAVPAHRRPVPARGWRWALHAAATGTALTLAALAAAGAPVVPVLRLLLTGEWS